MKQFTELIRFPSNYAEKSKWNQHTNQMTMATRKHIKIKIKAKQHDLERKKEIMNIRIRRNYKYGIQK